MVAPEALEVERSLASSPPCNETIEFRRRTHRDLELAYELLLLPLQHEDRSANLSQPLVTEVVLLGRPNGAIVTPRLAESRDGCSHRQKVGIPCSEKLELRVQFRWFKLKELRRAAPTRPLWLQPVMRQRLKGMRLIRRYSGDFDEFERIAGLKIPTSCVRIVALADLVEIRVAASIDV